MRSPSACMAVPPRYGAASFGNAILATGRTSESAVSTTRLFVGRRGAVEGRFLLVGGSGLFITTVPGSSAYSGRRADTPSMMGLPYTTYHGACLYHSRVGFGYKTWIYDLSGGYPETCNVTRSEVVGATMHIMFVDDEP